MKKVIDNSDSRGHSLYDWLDSHHTFSFDEYYNPRRMKRQTGYSRHPYSKA